MLTVPSTPTTADLVETAIAAAGGGTVVRLDTDPNRPDISYATVRARRGLVHVALDAQLGTAVIAPPVARPLTRRRARPSRRSVPAHR